MISETLRQRLEDLDKRAEKDTQLLKELEEKHRLERHPTEREKLNQEIKQVKENIKQCIQDYQDWEELLQRSTQESSQSDSLLPSNQQIYSIPEADASALPAETFTTWTIDSDVPQHQDGRSLPDEVLYYDPGNLFTNREDRLRFLERFLLNPTGKQTTRIAIIAGVGGVGKSALAFHFASQYRDRFPGGVIYQLIEGKTLNTIAQELVEKLDVRSGDRNLQEKIRAIQNELRRRQATLIIFDGVEQEDQLQNLYQVGERNAVLITTRDTRLLIHSFRDQIITVAPLMNRDATSLLKKFFEIDDERLNREQLEIERIAVTLLDGLPLAIKLAGETLSFNEWISFSIYAASLKLDTLSQESTKDRNIRACFNFSLKWLNQEQKEFFARLSVCSKSRFSLIAAKVVNDYHNDSKVHEALSTLYRYSLINYHRSLNRFTMHPLIQEFSGELADQYGVREDARQRYEQFIRQIIRLSKSETHRLESETDPEKIRERLSDFIQAAQWLKEKRIPYYDFTKFLSRFFNKRGYYVEAAEIMEIFQSLAASRQDWDQDVLYRVQWAKYLLRIRTDLPRVQEILEPGRDILTRIDSQDIRLNCEVRWLTTYADILKKRGRLDDARTHLDRAVQLEKQLKVERQQDYSLGLAKALTSLGGVLLGLGIRSSGSQRQEYFEQSEQRLNESINEERNNPDGRAIALTSLGDLLRHQNRHSEAIQQLESACDIKRRRRNDKDGLARGLNILGEIYIQLRDFNKAATALEESIRLKKELGDRHGLEISLDNWENLLRDVQQHQNHDTQTYCERIQQLVPNNQRFVRWCSRYF